MSLRNINLPNQEIELGEKEVICVINMWNGPKWTQTQLMIFCREEFSGGSRNLGHGAPTNPNPKKKKTKNLST